MATKKGKKGQEKKPQAAAVAPPNETQAQAAVRRVAEKFGASALRAYGAVVDEPIEVISTGCLDLDRALGRGGYPRGRIVEIYGPESSGKTTLALHALAEAQKLDGIAAAFIDAEHALDPVYAARLGVRMEDLLINQPDSAEQALDVTIELAASGMGIIVVDSATALVPLEELEGSVGDSKVGLQARLLSKALRRLCGVASKTNTLVLFLNQMRTTGIGGYQTYMAPTGGNALRFYASVRLTTKRGDKIAIGGTAMGNTHTVTVVKNKVGKPYQEATFDNIWGQGIDRYADLREAAVANGVIRLAAGGRYYHGDTQVAHGSFNFRELLEDQADHEDGWTETIRKELAARGVHWVA